MSDDRLLFPALSFIFCRRKLLREVYTRWDNAAFANFVAAASRTISNWFEFVRLITVTKFCRSDNYFHEINRVTQGDLLQRLVPATCRSDLSPSVSRPLLLRLRNLHGHIQNKRTPGPWTSPLEPVHGPCPWTSPVDHPLFCN